MNLKVKVCGMREPENIRQLVELNVDMIGFIFYSGSPRSMCTPPEELPLIPQAIKRTGVFVNENTAYIQNKTLDYSLDVIQLHGRESVAECRELKKNYQIIKVFSVDEAFDFDAIKKYEEHVDFFLFDTKSKNGQEGGTGKKFSWEILQDYHSEIPLFLSGGINPDDADMIKEICNLIPIHGIDINSGFEHSPGLKDIDQINAFLRKLGE
jgi:phosphoribosylanthranilate isomerase